MAEQQVQAAINAAHHLSAARSAEPADLQQGQSGGRADPDPGADFRHAAAAKVEDLADTALAQKISQLPGVGLVSISGGQKPAVRIQANPTALASYGLSLEDLRTALAAANVNQAKGNLDGPRQAFTIGANDQLMLERAVQPVVVAYKNGAPVRLTDVANVDRRRGKREAGRLDEH